MAYKIVPISKKHIEGFNKALGVVAREKKYITFEKRPPLAATRKFVLNNIKNDNPQFVVLDNGKVVGWCDIIPGTRKCYKHVGEMGICLLPEYRDKGIGAKLIKKTIKKAKEKGIKRIELEVISDNRNALSLYLKLGFQIEGLKKKALLLDGKYKDDYIMSKFI